MSRIDSVDAFRGLALLLMIFWQMFDFFSIANIYTDAPFYLKEFNMPIHGIVVGLFAFIAGFGIYLSISKRTRENKFSTLKHGFSRYFGYILISLVFTTFVFGFNVFFGWEEVIQGIGLSGLIAFCLILFNRSKLFLGILALGLIILQSFALNFAYQQTQEGLAGFLVNLSVRGFFSIINILPLILIGAIVATYFTKSKAYNLLLVGFILIIFSLISHQFVEIDYYNRSVTYSIFFTGVSVLLFSIIDAILKKRENFVLFKPLKTIGKGALLGYLLHFLLIYKTSVVFGFNSIFDSNLSIIFSIISIIIIYFVVKIWIDLKERKSWKTLWI